MIVPKLPTNNSKFPSRYSPNVFVTAAQYICEFVCENAARKQKKDLPIKFWEIPYWGKYFRAEIKTINDLLTTYPEYLIIRVLRENPKIISLRPPWVKDIIEQESLIVKKQKLETEIKEINKKLTIESPRKTFTKGKSPRSLLS
jgi:hypothetical protein